MSALDTLLSIVAPHECVGCGSEGSILCFNCINSITSPPDRCYRCHKVSTDSAVCQTCRRSSNLKHVWVVADYENEAKAVIQKFKFERAYAAASVIAGLMSEALPFLADHLVVAVPTASVRVRERGYDQSRLIAKRIATAKDLQYAPLLARGLQSRQVGASRRQRIEQMRNMFRVTSPKLAEGRRVLLVDDVSTTGATIEAAAKTLKNAGVQTVDAVIFAQKQ